MADNGDAHGRRSLLGGVVLALIRLPLSCLGETLGPTSGPGDGGVTASFPPWRHRLVARGVPKVWLESVPATALGVSLQGAMYIIVGALSTTPSLGLLGPCHPPADFLLAQMGGGTLVCVALGSWSSCRGHRRWL